MPDSSHVGRRYRAEGQVIDLEGAGGFARALAGSDHVAAELGPVPPTFAGVFALFPTLGQLFLDPDVGLKLDGLVHGEQEFTFHAPLAPGDVVDATAEIVSVEQKRGRAFITVSLEGTRPDGSPLLSGRALLIAPSDAS